MSLKNRAMNLTNEVEALLSSTAGVMVPGAVKAVIHKQNGIIEDMAREIERLYSITDDLSNNQTT